MKTYVGWIKSVVYNKVEVEAENLDDATEKMNNLIGEINLCEGDVSDQNIAWINETKEN